MRKAEATRFVVNAVFFSWPTLVGAVLYNGLKLTFTMSGSDRGIESTAISALVGYSFTAAFFLAALPRSDYLDSLDKKGHTLPYAIVLLLPAVTGVVQLVLGFLSSQSGTSVTRAYSNLFFFITVANFFWSLFIVIRILRLHRRP